MARRLRLGSLCGVPWPGGYLPQIVQACANAVLKGSASSVREGFLSISRAMLLNMAVILWAVVPDMDHELAFGCLNLV